MSAVIVSAGFGQQAPSKSAPSPSGKKSGEAVKKADKRLPDVAWTSSFDKFKGVNRVDLILRNISATDPKYFMDISAIWQSAQQEDKPATMAYNYIGFGSSLDSSGAKLAQAEGVLLLNDSKRVFLTGSPVCGLVRCNQRKSKNAFEPWVIADLALANKVEGKVDGVEFALNKDQIAAIGDFRSSRQLVSWANFIDEWQRKTAREAAIAINQTVRGYDRNLDGRFRLSDLTIFGLTDQAFMFEYVRNARYERERQTERAETKLGDLMLTAAIQLSCADEDSECASYTVLSGKPEVDPTAHYVNNVKASSMSIGPFWIELKHDPTVGVGLAYIFYRVMYCDDHVSFYTN